MVSSSRRRSLLLLSAITAASHGLASPSDSQPPNPLITPPPFPINATTATPVFSYCSSSDASCSIVIRSNSIDFPDFTYTDLPDEAAYSSLLANNTDNFFVFITSIHVASVPVEPSTITLQTGVTTVPCCEPWMSYDFKVYYGNAACVTATAASSIQGQGVFASEYKTAFPIGAGADIATLLGKNNCSTVDVRQPFFAPNTKTIVARLVPASLSKGVFNIPTPPVMGPSSKFSAAPEVTPHPQSNGGGDAGVNPGSVGNLGHNGGSSGPGSGNSGGSNGSGKSGGSNGSSGSSGGSTGNSGNSGSDSGEGPDSGPGSSGNSASSGSGASGNGSAGSGSSGSSGSNNASGSFTGSGSDSGASQNSGSSSGSGLGSTLSSGSTNDAPNPSTGSGSGTSGTSTPSIPPPAISGSNNVSFGKNFIWVFITTGLLATIY